MITIVGINPGSPMKLLKKNSTIDRLNNWMDTLEIKNWGFLNVISASGNYNKLKKDTDFVISILQNEDKIIALGGFVSNFLSKNNINHFMLPHPSPLNRKLNDKKFEIECLENAKRYINE